jgi:hypothetical protein
MKRDRPPGSRPSLLRPTRPVPAAPPDTAGEPTDDELLRYLDGALTPEEEAALEVRIAASPLATARLEILADALAEHDADSDDGGVDRLPD